MPRGFEKFNPLRIVTVLVGLLVLITIGGWLYLNSPRQTRLGLAKVEAPCEWDSDDITRDCRQKCDQAFQSWTTQKVKIGNKVWNTCCPTGYLPDQGTHYCKKVQ